MANNKPVNFSFPGFFKLIRFPNLAIIALTQYFTAIFLIHAGHQWASVLADYKLLAISISTILIAAAGYIINDYYDVKIDFVNKPERVVVDKLLKRRVVMAAHSVLNFTGIAVGFFLTLKIVLINFLSALLLWLYSNHLKRLPFVGNLAVAFLTGVALMVVVIYYQKNVFLVLVYAIFAFSITLIREIIKDIEDVKGDTVFGCKTLPVIWGIRKTKMIIYLLSAVFTALLFYLASVLNNPTLIIFFTVLIIPLSYFVYRLVIADTKKDFSYLSTYCKILMLSGILSMAFFSS
ncbi:geranylgeranylglycerol-phosphate geranylgeranyltransferase [Fulvivirgaceae bacterium BMA12]|uniref:Geranylgeranylglycerol-phosphate geranylgeranyltransferase n=1 Tax=Agaribacillus aureus TaxID=3051825 RepID=A0ABT8L4D3_9BACT|nr:geranylgeranylglycerol-phosphate geranylgeranyltransferase [Fulvivirgaceae bacterium BMA12]